MNQPNENEYNSRDNRNDNNIKIIKKKEHVYKFIGLKSEFDEYLFEKYDIPARNTIKSILGDFVIDNPDKYEQDLIITDSECKYKFLELQVCATWISDSYPFKTLFVYERKKRYDNDTLFLTLSKNFDQGYLFDAKSFKDAKPRRIKKYSREYVYDIPWNRAVKVFTRTLDKETIMFY